MGLEDRELPGLLLFLSLIVKAQDCLVHDAGKKSYLLYLLLFWHSSQFILKRYRDFGFEEAFLLLVTHATNTVPKLTEFVKYWNFNFGTGFGTISYA
jgi:hypothetical protein